MKLFDEKHCSTATIRVLLRQLLWSSIIQFTVLSFQRNLY